MATKATTQSNPQERIAREQLGYRCFFVGVDGEDAAHYWNYYTETICVVADGDATLYALEDTPCAFLGDWCEHVKDKRGWDVGPHVGGSIVDDLLEGL